ncbi:MAG: TfoX family protein [Chloroflexi bacterium]|nr:MAG: TfoX family protein [Chloroflexota bacterium]
MAYDHNLAQCIIENLQGVPAVDEKKMFGGVGYMIHGNMAVGVHRNDLIVRVGPENHAEAMKRPHTRPFDMTGRPMSGWLVVEAAGIKDPAVLAEWIQLGVAYAQSLPPK